MLLVERGVFSDPVHAEGQSIARYPVGTLCLDQNSNVLHHFVPRSDRHQALQQRAVQYLLLHALVFGLDEAGMSTVRIPKIKWFPDLIKSGTIWLNLNRLILLRFIDRSFFILFAIAHSLLLLCYRQIGSG